MEPIFFYFKETPLGVDNRFTLDFSNTELIYQINVSTEKDYYITTMNCNLVIAKYYGGLLDVIKKFSTKSRLLLEKRSSISVRFIFSRISIIFSRYGKKQINWIFSHIKRTLIFLVGNINFTISQIIK